MTYKNSILCVDRKVLRGMLLIELRSINKSLIEYKCLKASGGNEVILLSYSSLRSNQTTKTQNKHYTMLAVYHKKT